MCISQGMELVLRWLEEHDSFTIPNDYKSLDWKIFEEDKSSEEEQEAAIRCGLDELEKESAVRSCSFVDGESRVETWVLLKSQKNSPRQIQLSPQTCKNIETVVNAYLPTLNLGINQQSDEKNIGEADVIILMSVINTFAKQLEENIPKNRNRKKS